MVVEWISVWLSDAQCHEITWKWMWDNHGDQCQGECWIGWTGMPRMLLVAATSQRWPLLKSGRSGYNNYNSKLKWNELRSHHTNMGPRTSKSLETSTPTNPTAPFALSFSHEPIGDPFEAMFLGILNCHSWWDLENNILGTSLLLHVIYHFSSQGPKVGVLEEMALQDNRVVPCPSPWERPLTLPVIF